MKLLDVNILVYAHREDALEHSRYHRWLLDALEGQERLAVSALVLSGFLRIVTHPKIFGLTLDASSCGCGGDGCRS